MLNRIFLSADIEGTCGIAHWDETELGKPDYEPFRRQMTREVAAARRMGIEPSVGPLYSSDIFYDESGMSGKLKKLGVLAVEMESAALYLNAARAGKNALAICTISDHLSKNESLDAQARQSSFTQMMEIALDIA